MLPRRTRDVLIGLVEGQASGGVLGIVPVESKLGQHRARVGRFIGASGDEVAFLRNTGDGANVIARGLDWQPGDELIVCDNEFGANALPWLALRELGVVPRIVETARERLTPDVLRRMMTPRTRVVAVSWVSFGDGYRHDLAGLAEVAHEGGALLCVDVMQALGAFGVDVKATGIDALYAGGAKWLLALPGVSFLYVSRALQERLAVRWRGWRDVDDIWDFLAYDQPLAPNASRYEGGTLNYLGVAALTSSMDVLDEAGVPAISRHVLALTGELRDRLTAEGARVLGDPAPAVASGIVTFTLPGLDPIELGRALGEDGIVTTYRSTGVRVSPHGHNSADDISALLSGIERFKARRF